MPVVSRKVLASVLSTLTLGAGFALPGSVAQAAYAPEPQQTWAPTSGRVYAVERVGGTVLLGGTFTHLRSSQSGATQARAGLAALDAATGALLPWNPGAAGGEVRALETSADGAQVFVGGTFTTLAGASSSGLGAVQLSSGAAVPGFRTALAYGGVFALERSGSSLLLGGSFTQVNGYFQSRLAAVSTATGERVPTFKASADAKVMTLQLTPDGKDLLVGGAFRKLSGTAHDYLGSVSPATGAASAWQPPAACLSTDNPCLVYDVTSDGQRVYAGIGGPGGQVRAYDAVTGTSAWSGSTDGDVQAVALSGTTLYAGGHFDTAFAGQPRAGLVALDAARGSVLTGFRPEVRGGTGIWAILPAESELRVGGHFDTVDGAAVARYAQFPVETRSAPGTLVPAGSTWSYRDDGVAPSASWTDAGYDASSWRSGPAQLGFGDGDERTVLTRGHITYWARTTFDLTDPSGYRSATLRLLRDDGALVRVNGVEVARTNLPAGAITASTLATATVDGSAESAWTEYAVPASALRAGTNVVSVEVHQVNASSSDISLDVQLDAA